MKGFATTLNVTVSATAGKTYAARIIDRTRSTSGTTATATIVDGTTVSILLTATETENIIIPRALNLNEPRAFWGYWYLSETGGVNGNVNAAFGPVDWLRPEVL